MNYIHLAEYSVICIAHFNPPLLGLKFMTREKNSGLGTPVESGNPQIFVPKICTMLIMHPEERRRVNYQLRHFAQFQVVDLQG